MKKSILMLAVIVAAIVTQAATITWKSGVLYTVADESGKFSGDKAKQSATAYYFLIDNNDSAAYAGEWASKSGADLYAAYKSGDLAKAASVKSDAITSNNGGQANWASTTDTSNGTYAYAVAIYITTYDGKEYYIANGSSASVNLTGVVSGGADIGGSVGKWTAASTDPVPEPCTVALLALGLAAAGLKRKVA